MTSFGATWARVIAAALLAVSPPVLGTPAPAGAADRRLPLIEQIELIQARDGSNAAELLEPLTGLILLSLEDGGENEAAVLMERAIQIVRINRGLHSLDQAPLIRQLIAIEERRGKHAAAWNLEQDLLDLLKRHPDDRRTVAFLREIAHERLAVLEAFLAGERPPQIEAGCFYKESLSSNTGSCGSGSTKTVVHGLLGEAQWHYSDAIAVLLRNEAYSDGELRALEMDLLRVVTRLRPFDADPRQSHLTVVPRFAPPDSYEPWRTRSAAITELAKWTPSPSRVAAPSDGDTLDEKHAGLRNSYYRGRQILRRVYAYAAASPSAGVESAAAIALLADWELMYSHRNQAMERYERAHDLLRRDGAAAAIERAFAPATPVVLPAFEPNPLARDETREPSGHVDVEFEITQSGRARRIAIVGSRNAADGALERLERLIAASTFRPRVTDGQFRESAPVLFRYHLYE